MDIETILGLQTHGLALSLSMVTGHTVMVSHVRGIWLPQALGKIYKEIKWKINIKLERWKAILIISSPDRNYLPREGNLVAT